MFGWIKKRYRKTKKAVKRAAYKKAIQYWIWWSNWNIRKENFRVELTLVPDYNFINRVQNYWSRFTKGLQWKPDGAQFLFDSITTTQNILKNGGDDCDGFAYLAMIRYAKGFRIRSASYRFDHFHTYKRGMKGHVVAIFKAHGGEAIVYSNKTVMYWEDYHTWDNATNESEIRVNSKNKLYLHKII